MLWRIMGLSEEVKFVSNLLRYYMRDFIIYEILYCCNEKELDLLVQAIHIFSKDIGMEFGMEKCAMLVIEKGKIMKSICIELPNGKDGKVFKSLQEGESYKYLGILEAERVLGEEMKLKVSQ